MGIISENYTFFKPIIIFILVINVLQLLKKNWDKVYCMGLAKL